VISLADSGLPTSEAAAREEDDLDQTVVGALSSSLGNTRFNTLRLAFTQEHVVMANPGFDANGHRQDLLPPTLRYLTYVDQQINVAQVKIDHAYQADDTFSWFVPGKKGDHDLRVGVAIRIRARRARHSRAVERDVPLPRRRPPSTPPIRAPIPSA
jgi:hypothetical protein